MSYRAKTLMWYLDGANDATLPAYAAAEYARIAFIVAARLIGQNCPERSAS